MSKIVVGKSLLDQLAVSQQKRAPGLDFTAVVPFLDGLYAALAAGLGAIMSFTRDGGALCVTLLEGDNRQKFYCSSDDDLVQLGEALKKAYQR